MILNLFFQGESVAHTGVAASSGSICGAVICEPRVMMCVSEQRVIAGSAPPLPLPSAGGRGDIWHLLLEHVVTAASECACCQRQTDSVVT